MKRLTGRNESTPVTACLLFIRAFVMLIWICVPPRASADSKHETEEGVIHVDANAVPGGDGSGRFPFNNIASALARAASFGGAVVVVEPGQYPVSTTLQIQSPIELRGSN